METNILVFILVCLFSNSLAQDNGGCQIDPPVNFVTKILTIDATDVDGFSQSYTYSGDLTVTLNGNDDVKYVDVTYGDGQITIKNTTAFSNIEEDYKDRNTTVAPTLALSLIFNCGQGDIAVTLNVYLTDTNNNNPVFAKDTFSYTIPMPLVPKIDLLSLGDELTARDIDFTDAYNTITFSIEPKDSFDLTTEKVGIKEYRAVLKVTNYKTYNADTTFIITATDNGTPEPQNSTATIIIKKDPEFSLPDAPTFDNALYEYSYTENDGIPSISPINGDGEIKITTTDPSNTIVTISDDTHFGATYDSDAGVVTVKAKETPLPSSSESVVPLRLTATIAGDSSESETIILIHLPAELVYAAPTFSAPFYRGTYIVDDDGQDTIQLETDITVSQNAVVDVDDNHFSMSKNDDDTWSIIVATDLTNTDFLKSNTYKLFLHASITENSKLYESYSYVDISLPAPLQVPTFGLPSYTGTYEVNDDANGKDTVKLDADIQVNAPGVTPNVVIDTSNLSDHFDIQPNEDSTGYVITVKENLDDADLITKPDIVLTLQVEADEVAGTSQAALVIRLPKEITPAAFEQSFYDGTYDPDDNQIHDLPDILLTGSYVGDIQVTLSAPDELDGYFSLSSSSPYQVLINPDKNLSDETEYIQSHHEVILPLEAKLTDGTLISTSVVIIELPDVPSSFQFDHPGYTATYSDKTINSDEPINIEGADPSSVSVVAQVIGDNSGNAQFNVDCTSTCTITPAGDGLDQEILDSQSEIVLVLVASTPASSLTATATVIIALPLKDTFIAPEFTQTVYEGTYPEDGTGVISLKKDLIQIKDVQDITGIDVDFVEGNENNQYFAIVPNGDHYDVTTTTLPGTIIEDQVSILLNLQATKDGVSVKGFAGLVIELPKKIAPSPFHFEQNVYMASYDETGAFNMDDDAVITIDGDDDGNIANITLSGDESYIDYFEQSYDGSTVTITLKGNLPPDVLDENAVISIYISATKEADSVATATLVVRLPKVAVNPFRFDKNVYRGNYDEESGLDAPDIIINGDSDNSADITLDGDPTYKDLFNFTHTSNTVHITLAPVPKDILEQNVALSIDIIASKDSNTISATLLVQLPKPDVSLFHFENNTYIGDYNQEDGFTLDVTLVGDDDGTANITITGDPTYSDYFDRTYVDKKLTITLSNVPQTVIDNNIALYVDIVATKDLEETTATLIVRLPHEVLPSFRFDSDVYVGDYDETNGLVVEKDIKLEGDPGSHADFDLGGDYAAFFKDVYTDNILTLTLENLSQDVLERYATINLDIAAAIGETKAATTLIVRLPKSAASSLYFKSNVYEGDYNETTGLVLKNDIIIDGDSDGSANISFNGDESYVHLFSNTYADNKVTVILADVPQEILNQNVALYVDIIATKNSETSRASLVVRLPNAVASTFYFDENVYMGEYDDTNGLKVEKDITVEGDSDGTANIEISGDQTYENLFHVNHSGNTVIVSLDPVPSEILNTNTVLTIVITATKGDDEAQATLIVQLPKSYNSDAPQFSEVAYIASYAISADKKDTVSIDEDHLIRINGVTDVGTVNLEILGQDKYDSHFILLPQDDHWTLDVDQDLTEDVTSNEISLSLTLNAVINGVSGQAALVVELPKKSSQTVFFFSENAYLANYSKADGFKAEKPITVNGDVEGVNVIASGDNSNLFLVDYDRDTGNVAITATIPDDTVSSNAAISVDLVATKDDAITTAKVVVQFPRTNTGGADGLQFSKAAYEADYLIKPDKDDVDVDGDPIKIEGVTDTAEATLTIDQYQENFDLVPEDDHWNLVVKSDLPPDTISSDVSILLTLTATAGGLSGQAVVVVKLPKKSIHTDFYFDDNVYLVDYDVGDSLDVLTGIPIKGTVDSSVTISLGGDFSDLFSFKYNDDETVDVSLKEDIPKDIMDQNAAISVNIVATKGDERTFTTLVVRLPKSQGSGASFSFDKSIYEADYDIDDGKVSIELDDTISITGDTDNGISVTLTGAYAPYFNVIYADGTVTITPVSSFSSDVVNKETAITIEIVATKNGETATAALVVKLPKKESPEDSPVDDKTGLIAAVSVLAVLLVASLVGSAVFYYFKFRRGSNYANIEESRPSERFKKNSYGEAKSKFEHPTRRDTGVIKMPLENEAVGETNTDVEVVDRRKSVQFDTVNIDEMEIEKGDDEGDDTDELVDSEDNDGNEENEERRTSRV